MKLYPALLAALLASSACANALPEEPAVRTSPPDPPARSGGPCDFEVEAHAELELPVWDLIVDPHAWDALHADANADVEVDAAICIDGERYPIELELQGSSTRELPKKSFNLKLNRGKRLGGSPFGDGQVEDASGIGKVLMKAMLYDQSLIREAIAFDLFRAMGGEAPRVGFANLRINGAYWGLYALVEPINEDYVVRHGYPSHGRLYKATRKHGSFADFKPGRDLALAFEHKELDDWAESESEDESDEEEQDDDDERDPKDGREQDKDKDRDDIARLVHTLQSTPLTEEAFEREIEPTFPLDAYFERLIWVACTQNGDAVAQNYYLYNAPHEGRDRWHQLPWDSNLCFGADWRDPDAIRPPDAGLQLDGGNYFGRRLLQVPGVRERYIARFRDVLDEVLTPDVVFERFEHYSRLVERDLAVDQARWRRNVEPRTAFDALVDFFEARPGALRDGLTRLEARYE